MGSSPERFCGKDEYLSNHFAEYTRHGNRMNFLCMALAFVLLQTATPPQSASISGIVVEAGTGNPIANATVVILSSSGSPPVSTTTRRDGTFSLTNLKPGSGGITTSAPGYVSAVHPVSGAGSPLVWTGNQALANIRIEMLPTGTVAGRVVNRQGDPIANIAVQAVQLSSQNGHKVWRVVESRPTNDLGEYRLFWLNPGRYFIRTMQGDTVETSISAPTRRLSINEKLDIQPPDLVRIVMGDGTISDEAVLPIYYPGTREPELATYIDIPPGITAGIDFQASRVPVHRVRGRIMGASVESGHANTVRLLPLSTTGLPDTFPRDDLDLMGQIDGINFDIGGVPPGNYAVLADFQRSGTSMSARTTIDVPNSDINDLVIVPTPNVRVSANFIFDGDTSGGKASYSFAQFQLRSKLFGGDSIYGVSSGSLVTFENVPAGDYTVESSSLSVEIPGTNGTIPAYIESMRDGGRDILQDGLHVDGSLGQPISITLRNDFGNISGRVIGTALPFTGANVVLVPILRNDRARFRTTGASASGEFRFKDVAPGDYRVYVYRRSDFTDLLDPEFLAANEASSRAIKVAAGGETIVDAPFIIGDPKP